MDILMMLWIGLMGVIPPAIVGWSMYLYGRRQGRKSFLMAKEEIRSYVRGELVADLTGSIKAVVIEQMNKAVEGGITKEGVTKAIKDEVNGIFSGISKAGAGEGRQAAIEYSRENPGIAKLLMGVAGRGGARWLAKQFGMTRAQADMVAGLNLQGALPQGSSGPPQNQVIQPLPQMNRR